MYAKDKATRITLRLNEEQFNFVRSSAERYGVSPSEFLRMVINVTMFESDANTVKEGEKRRENEFADIHNIV